MNQMLERMCNLSSCCVSSREREREHDLRFERRTGENNRRGAGGTYSDYNFDPSAMSQEATPRQENMLNATAGQTDDNMSSAPKMWLSAVAKFPFQATDPQPFPPDPFPDLTLESGDKLRVFPSMSQYGWCFVVDQKDDTRRGWVPGNYITVNGREPFMKAGGADEDELWSEVNNNERNMVHLEISEVGREPKAPEDSPNLLQT